MTPAPVLFLLAVALGAAVFACRRNNHITPDGFHREYPVERQPYPLTPRQLRAAIVQAQVAAVAHAHVRAILSASPVDTGRARASWRAERACAAGAVVVDSLALTLELGRITEASSKAAKSLRSLGVKFREFGDVLRAQQWPRLQLNRPLGPHTPVHLGALDGKPWKEGDPIPPGMHVRHSPLDPGPPVIKVAPMERPEWSDRVKWYADLSAPSWRRWSASSLVS